MKVIIPFLLLIFCCCEKINAAGGRIYVLIVAGQSQATGRAPNSGMSSEIVNHKFTRTKIWSGIADAETQKWPTYVKPNYPKTTGWELLNPDYNQSFQQKPGQSGIEPEFAYQFEKTHPGDTLYIIKHSHGGIPIALRNGPDWNIKSQNELYSQFVQQYLTPAFASKELSGNYIPLGFWWAQGETDASDSIWASAYYANLVDFFNQLSIDAPSVNKFKKYIGRIAYPVITKAEFKEVVRDAQKKICDTYQYTLINCDDLDNIPNNGHFTAKGFETLTSILFPKMDK